MTLFNHKCKAMRPPRSIGADCKYSGGKCPWCGEKQ